MVAQEVGSVEVVDRMQIAARPDLFMVTQHQRLGIERHAVLQAATRSRYALVLVVYSVDDFTADCIGRR